MKGRNRSLGASAGAVVEIDGRNSVGAEFEYWRNRERGAERHLHRFPRTPAR